ncbi:MAG TPA: zf-TFIIB domain-containing protein [Longimicrobium sp.]|nr:zf-TFIIB domain-containing protein [Longimicrobium sp.]
MRDVVPLRLACPACLGVALEKVSPARGVEIDHCARCGGTWILREQAARLRAHPVAAVRATITRTDDAGFLCHGCHAPMDRDAAYCFSCSWFNRLECPACGKGMRRESGRTVTVDVCRGCKGVWLDHHELASLWAVAAAGAVAKAGTTGKLSAVDVDAGGFLLDVLWYAPDLAFGAVQASAHAVGAGVEAASHVPGLLASTPEALGAAAEAAANVAGAVFGFIAEAIAAIFEGLG